MFDLHSGGILGLIFRLEHAHYTTDFVKNQLKSLRVERWEQIGLTVCGLSGSQVAELDALYKQHGEAPGIADLSTVVLAKAYNASLVTRDHELAGIAMDRGVHVIHSLEVIEELVDTGVLSAADAASALREIMRKRRKFPQVRSLALLRKWTST